jgi:hypothetical protein
MTHLIHRLSAWILASFLLVLAMGEVALGQNPLPTTYGQRAGPGRVSLNGTSALARMLRSHEIDVQSASRLTPRIDRYKVMFWFPDTRREDHAQERERLEQWLQEGYRRRLIIVGRDYDATLDYLKQVGQTAEGEAGQQYRRRLAEAAAEAHLASIDQQGPFFDGWVEWKPGPHRPSTQIAGPWAAGLENAKMTTGRHPEPPSPKSGEANPSREYDVKLEVNEIPFAVSVRDPSWNQGEVVIISNGSFLLNYGLADPENRQVAEAMLDDLSFKDFYDSVLFLESGDGGLPVSKREESGQNTMWDWMTEWPFSFFIPHFLVLGLLVYFVFYPIFGRPKQIEPPSSTDFGQHVEALGELMEKTRDRAYAIRHINHYHEQTKTDSRGLGSPASDKTN